MPLPDTLKKSLQVTATVAITELYNEGKSAANDPERFPLAEISEILDNRTCPLCAAVDGMILKVGSKEYHEWRRPSHIGCRRSMAYIGADEVGTVADFEEPDAELIQKHGHFHTDPNKHAALRIPAEPAGRHVVVRRVKNLETGEIETRLDWAPWYDQVPQAKRHLVLKARETADGEQLAGVLEQLGITDLTDPEQRRQAVMLGLKDRVEGWVTTQYSSSSAMALPGWLRNLVERAPVLPIGRAHAAAETIAEAQEWALEHIPGLEHVDYSQLSLEMAEVLNETAAEVGEAFGIKLKTIAPYSHFGLDEEDGSILRAGEDWLAYHPGSFGNTAIEATRYGLAQSRQLLPGGMDLPAAVAHEMGHLLANLGRTSLGAQLGKARSTAKAKAQVDAYRDEVGEAEIRKLLGGRAWAASELPSDRHWEETWAQAFTLYWSRKTKLGGRLGRLITDVLKALYPDRF